MAAESRIVELLQVMARLRDPQGGCPWDLEQTLETMVPHTLEEAYEVADTVARGDYAELCDELGDLLFQVVFYARLAEESGHFDFDDVVAAIVAKLVRRHPHVFGAAAVGSTEEQTRAWEAHKAEERAAKVAEGAPASLLDGVARSLPALTRAAKLQRRAARAGFDWPDAAGVIGKVDEELAELREVLAGDLPQGRRGEEVGDLLFTCVNLARHCGVDPEAALREANAKFERRFRGVETALRARGSSPEQARLEEMDVLWTAQKRGEKSARD
jgi:ATP diphosphatase